MALINIDFNSHVLCTAESCYVVLPQQSYKNRDKDSGEKKKYSTLWLLHGMSDDETSWMRKSSIERYAEDMGLAVVMPSAQYSSYMNMAHGARWQDYIVQELPEIMREFFPLSDKREDNYIAGLSMGGFGCLRIGLGHPDKYAAIGCLSAGIQFKGFGGNDPYFKKLTMLITGGKDLTGTRDDVEYTARKIAEKNIPAPRIYHACGTEDGLIENAHRTRDFFKSFPGNPFDYTFEEGPGAHNWDFWDEYIQHFLKFIKR